MSDSLPDPRDPLDRALIDLCYERGFAEIAVEDLCERAGLERAEFDRRHTDLEACFCAVFERELDLLLVEFGTALENAGGWRERLRAVAYAFHRWLAADPPRTHLMVTEIRTAGDRAQAIQWRGIQQMIDLLDEGRSAAPDPDRITKATAEALAGGILTQIYAAVAEGPLRPEADLVPDLMYTAVLPYVGPDAAAEELRIAPPPRRREPLRQALIDLCWERGLAEVTVEGLCARAGLDPADFQTHYADIEDCFFATYSAEFSRYRRAAEGARAGLGSWRERLRATAYVLLRYLAEDERVTHFTVVEVRRAGDRSDLLIGEGIEELIDLLDEGRAEPGAPANLTRATAESVAGGLFNRLYLSVAHGDSPNEAEIVPEAMYAAVLPYLGVAVATEELRIPPPSDAAGRGEGGPASQSRLAPAPGRPGLS
jgi:AcrR family transcriptional regulator